jgi:glycosyltransferase involved in cell wall biosynthesis
MRILQVIHDFLPHHVAGSELYCFYLSQELAKRHAVDVMFTEMDTTRPQYSYRRWSSGGVTCHEVVHNHEYRAFEHTYADLRMEEIFTTILDDVRPDVVHVHHLMHHSINYPTLSKIRGIPVVFTLHDYWLSCPNYGQRLRPDHVVCERIDLRDCANCVGRFTAVGPIAAKARSIVTRVRTRMARGGRRAKPDEMRATLEPVKALYHGIGRLLTTETTDEGMSKARRRRDAVLEACRAVDLFIAPSRFLADKMVAYGLPADRVVHSPNGMRTDLLRIERRPSNRIRVGYVGSLAPHKGVHILIEAFTRLLAMRPSGRRAELQIHGNLEWFPQYVARLRALAGSAPVKFLGEFDPNRVGEIYAGLDLLAIPSIWWENAPLTLSEAFLTGTPVIVSDCGSMPGLVGPETPTFKSGDADDLARQLAAFCDGAPPAARRANAPADSIKTIADDAMDTESRYVGLIATKLSAAKAQAGAGTY